jgi:hypothetical protein
VRGIAATGLLALALGSNGVVLASEGDPRSRTSALRLLETLTVPVTSNPQAVIPTSTSLRKSASYRLVISGAITATATGPGYSIGDKNDAFYCYESFGSSPNVAPGASCTSNIRRSSALTILTGAGSQPVDTALGLPPGSVRYRPSHRYSLSFKARRRGKLNFQAFQQAAISTTGSFTVKLYGGAAKKKKKKRKRIGGCPVRRSSAGTVGAAGTCQWVVDFHLSQKGVPTSSLPAVAPELLTPGFVETETQVIGKMFFSAQPRTGRTTVGRVAAILVHTDTYQSLVNPFAFTDGETKVEAISGTYLRRSGEARIQMKAFVTQVTGPPFAKDSQGNSVQAGDQAGVLLVAEPPREDRLVILMGCEACGFARGSTIGSHGHRYIEERENTLSVKIGRPKPL